MLFVDASPEDSVATLEFTLFDSVTEKFDDHPAVFDAAVALGSAVMCTKFDSAVVAFDPQNDVLLPHDERELSGPLTIFDRSAPAFEALSTRALMASRVGEIIEDALIPTGKNEGLSTT